MSDQINTNADFQISGDTLRKYTGQSRHLVITEDIKGIASAAFLDVSTLESVTIPDGVEFLDRRSFENCIHLKTVSIPDSVTRIGEYAFSGCQDLDYVKLPAGLSRIESYTFRNCTSLTAVIIPPGVTEIAVDAFIGCSSLEGVHIHEGVTSFPAVFNHHPFTGCEKLKIYTPSGSAAERFAIDNGIPYVIKTIDSPNQATDIVKPETSKPKVTRQTIASTKGIFSFSDIEEYLPEDLTEKLLKKAEEADAVRKARIAAAAAQPPVEAVYDEESEAVEEVYVPDEVYAPEEVVHEDPQHDKPETVVTAVEKPVEIRKTQPAKTVVTPVVEPVPVAEKPAVKKEAPPVVEPVPVVTEKPAVSKDAPPVVEPIPVVAEKPAVKKEAPPAAPKTVDTAETAEPAKETPAVKAEKPAKPAKPAKKKKAPKEKPVKEKKPPKEKPVKQKKEKKKKEPKPKSSKGRTARIAALLVIAAVATAVIVLAVMNMNGTKTQTSDKPSTKTEATQKDDYVLTLEDFVNSNDTAKNQIDQSIDGTDVKVTVSGNKLIYTYDLSKTEGLSADDADSDEIRTALEGTLDASNDRFVELCRSLEKDTGISGISVEVIYSYGDKILLTREYTANGQKQ